jgi:hypothetical protein
MRVNIQVILAAVLIFTAAPVAVCAGASVALAAQQTDPMDVLRQAQTPEEQITAILGLQKNWSQIAQSMSPSRARETEGLLWMMLGLAYHDQSRGYDADALENALNAFEKALPFFPREDSPEDWAMVQDTLADIYADRAYGARADNLERAIHG